MPRTTARRHAFGAARKPNRILGGAAAGVALLVLSACADDGDGVASAGGEANPADPAGIEEKLDEGEQALVFAECMRENGIAMPDPGPGQQGLGQAFQSVAGNYDRATVEQALAACEDLIPRFAQEEEHLPGDMLALAECLREQGLDVSDNPFEDAHAGNIDPNEFTAAMETCRQVLMGGGQ